MYRIRLAGGREGLERWSARATLAVLAGIAVEAAILMWFKQPHLWETFGTALAYILISAGLAAEYVVILLLSDVNQRTGDAFAQRLAEIEVIAAEASRLALEAQLA